MEKNTLNIIVVTLIVAILASVSIILFSPLFSDESTDTMPWSETLLNSAILGGNYLVNATDDQGIFVYDYDPVENVESGSYNILRHAGTVYSMLQLYDVTGDEQLLLSSEKAINYLLSFEKSVVKNYLYTLNELSLNEFHFFRIVQFYNYNDLIFDTSYQKVFLHFYLKLNLKFLAFFPF